MRIKILALIGASIAVSLPAHAQDISSPYDSAITDHAQTQLESTLSRRRIQQAQQRKREPLSSAEVKKVNAACRDKKRVAAGFSSAAAVRKFYAACATMGY